MHPNSTHPPIPHSLPTSAFQPLHKARQNLKMKPKQKFVKVGAAVWPSEYHGLPFSSHFLTCKCSLHELLVWYEASGFRYTTDTGSSLGFFLDILLSCVTEIPQLWICRSSPCIPSGGSQMMWTSGWANSKPWF